MWPSPYLVCVPCVQQLSAAQKGLSQPSLSKAKKSELEEDVKKYERLIQIDKKNLLDKEKTNKDASKCHRATYLLRF